MVALAAVTAASALVAFAIAGEVVRKARLPGLLTPAQGFVAVIAPQAGVLVELPVREGNKVSAGQVLAVLSSERNTAHGGVSELISVSIAQRRQTLEAERLLAQRQGSERRAALAERLRSMARQMHEAEAERDAAFQRVQLAQRSLERQQQLVRDGFVSQAQVQQRHEELLDAQTRWHTAQRAVASLRGEMQAVAAERQSNDTAEQTTLAQLDRSLAALEQERGENEARRQVVVTAPRDATVSAVLLTEGQAVQAGQAMLNLVAGPPGQATELQAHLYATSRAAGFVQPGQAVWLCYAAYPYQKFGMGRGEIVAVSRTPIGPQDLPPAQANALLAAAQSNEPMYRITVKLHSQHVSAYGQPQRLKPGMAVEADVLQDRRAVWEWMLDPVLAAWKGTQVLGDVATKASSGG
ncbi:MAG: HlyD family secretion protein [Pseudomonadota bacterium]